MGSKIVPIKFDLDEVLGIFVPLNENVKVVCLCV